MEAIKISDIIQAKEALDKITPDHPYEIKVVSNEFMPDDTIVVPPWIAEALAKSAKEKSATDHIQVKVGIDQIKYDSRS